MEKETGSSGVAVGADAEATLREIQRRRVVELGEVEVKNLKITME